MSSHFEYANVTGCVSKRPFRSGVLCRRHGSYYAEISTVQAVTTFLALVIDSLSYLTPDDNILKLH